MEVTALHIRHLMNGFILLVVHVQQSYPQVSVADAELRIIPTRLQVFEYKPVSFTCEGFHVSAGWRVRNHKEFIRACPNSTVTSAVTCTIQYALLSDSGEYWCERVGGQRSNAVNITVTGGKVILESPALPVTENSVVTLRCRKQNTSSDVKANFYKDGHLIGNSSTGDLTFQNVSKSDEGRYKCSTPGAGESPESWLFVKEDIPKYSGSVEQSEDSNEEHVEKTASDKEIQLSHHYYFLLWFVITVVLVLQLLVIGLLYQKKQLVLLEAKLNPKDLHNIIEKDKKTRDAADNLSFYLNTNHSTAPQTEKDSDEVLQRSFHSTFTADYTAQRPKMCAALF